ncbi:MAG: hypothetical protein GY702_04300 [Desulfobulbaceae bacterium]|nr:hypothetical protein [Desulfobulbaceae bacterium]
MVFSEKQLNVETEVNAKKEVYNGEAAWQVIASAKKVYVASGKKTLEFDPATADKEEMLKKITGRTGNLRAPALKVGDVYYVGFNQSMYEGF